ncbi:MAG: hypothetical protein ACREM3_05245 [Candidatus Rokuibacteriota bacterium]
MATLALVELGSDDLELQSPEPLALRLGRSPERRRPQVRLL